MMTNLIEQIRWKFYRCTVMSRKDDPKSELHIHYIPLLGKNAIIYYVRDNVIWRLNTSDPEKLESSFGAKDHVSILSALRDNDLIKHIMHI